MNNVGSLDVVTHSLYLLFYKMLHARAMPAGASALAHPVSRPPTRHVVPFQSAPGPAASRAAPRRQWRARSAELEEVDPMTGEIISNTSMATFAPESVEVGGLSWAYRTADVAAAAATPDKLPVLCLHGLGSSSYAFRGLIRLLGAEGHRALALDWPGHGASAKPAPGAFPYSQAAYVAALDAAVDALPIDKPLALVVHGYVLGQYALLWAAAHPEKVARLVILNTPLSLKAKLRPELAAYKAPLAFMRPKPSAPFDGATYNAAGGPYAMAYKDAVAYAAPYEADPAASAAVYATMGGVDFPALLAAVDEAFLTWRAPSMVIHGGGDTFLDLKGPLDWLESKRTAMRMASGIEAKVGHAPQEDYPEAIAPAIVKFLAEAA